MALAAAQVVDALAARVAPQAAVSGRVKTSRTWPWSEAELPACRIFAADERVEPAEFFADGGDGLAIAAVDPILHIEPVYFG